MPLQRVVAVVLRQDAIPGGKAARHGVPMDYAGAGGKGSVLVKEEPRQGPLGAKREVEGLRVARVEAEADEHVCCEPRAVVTESVTGLLQIAISIVTFLDVQVSHHTIILS